mgnify:CR=1 FL=1
MSQLIVSKLFAYLFSAHWAVLSFIVQFLSAVFELCEIVSVLQRLFLISKFGRFLIFNEVEQTIPNLTCVTLVSLNSILNLYSILYLRVKHLRLHLKNVIICNLTFGWSIL